MLKPALKTAIDGAKKYSPPFAVTKSLTGLMLTDFAPIWKGLGGSLALPWPMVTSRPAPGKGKPGWFAQSVWMNL